jgi:hypothetical protein
MSNGNDTHGSEPPDSDARRDSPSDVAEVTLVARVQAYDDQPDTCTIHPADADDWEVLTTWMSADDGSFVPLVEMR